MRHNEDVNEIYLIENYQTNLDPVLPSGTLHESASWNILIEKLKQLGVKKFYWEGSDLKQTNVIFLQDKYSMGSALE